MASSLSSISHDRQPQRLSDTASLRHNYPAMPARQKECSGQPPCGPLVPKATVQSTPSMSRSPDIHRILRTGQLHSSWSDGGNEDLITCNPGTGNPGSARVQRWRPACGPTSSMALAPRRQLSHHLHTPPPREKGRRGFSPPFNITSRDKTTASKLRKRTSD